MNQLTDKTWVLVLRDNVRLYLNEQDAEKVKQAVSSGAGTLDIQGRLIMKQAILYLISASDQDVADKIRKGWWKCANGVLHDPKYKDCSC